MNAQLATIPQNHIGQIQPLFNDEETSLIKELYAKDSTETEFKIFLWNAGNRGLDPRKNQIYFIKRGGKATFQVSIDGYRLIAQRTGKLKGIERGIRREAGELYAWAKVWRSDWERPAYEEVSVKEYIGTTPTWQKMPETMLKKCAETAALRMAFPDELGGTYGEEEMDQVDRAPGQIVNVSHQDSHSLYVAERETPKVIMAEINDLIGAYDLKKEEIQSSTGVQTFKGMSLPELEEAKRNIEEFVGIKVEMSEID